MAKSMKTDNTGKSADKLVVFSESVEYTVTDKGKERGLKDGSMHPLKAETLEKKGFIKISK